MKLLAVLLSLTAFVSAEFSESDYPKDNPIFGYLTRYGIAEADRIQKAEERYLENISSRIIGGIPAGRGLVPFQAGLILDLTRDRRGVCGGTLVSNMRVLTAAHCWFDGINRAQRVTVVLGSTTIFTGGERQVSYNVVMHPQWTPSLIRNDIAVIRLPTYVAFSATIGAVVLPSGAQLYENFVGDRATVSGFGLTSSGGSIAADQFLSIVQVPVIRNDICAAAFLGLGLVQNTNICTSTLQGAGPARGDSGGPLTIIRGGRPLLIGLVSFGFGPASASGIPSVYARVTSFDSFIKANL